MKSISEPKLYGTLGPACQDPACLADMIRSGMTGMRINLSHGTLDSCRSWLDAVDQARAMTHCDLDLLIDLQGPELRLGDFAAAELSPGQLVTLGEGGLPVPGEVIGALVPGDELLVDDGAQLWRVLDKDEDSLVAEVVHGGFLFPRKSLALPEGREVQLPVLSPQDYINLERAAELGIRQVMMPFVHSAADIRFVREHWATLCPDPIMIFAKIEDPTGAAHLEDFVDEADVIVIARGDLGSHIPLTELPAMQLELTRICRKHERPFLVVTQMLHSMIHAPTPTRAEVTDIALAVISGAWAIMLTGETAMGDYPREAMEVFARTARSTHSYALKRGLIPSREV